MTIQLPDVGCPHIKHKIGKECIDSAVDVFTAGIVMRKLTKTPTVRVRTIALPLATSSTNLKTSGLANTNESKYITIFSLDLGYVTTSIIDILVLLCLLTLVKRH